MSFRNWLLTGTSLSLLVFAPMSAVRAQDATDPALVAAYQAYQADQSEANQTALTEACIAAGFTSLDHLGKAYHPALVPGQPKPPATIKPGQTVTFELRVVMVVGEGLMRYAPDGTHIAASWDFVVEND